MLSLWVEWVSEEACLGSVITDEGSKPDLLSTIAQTTAALTRLKPVSYTHLTLPTNAEV